jgi:plasmid stabilization system protein ParE
MMSVVGLLQAGSNWDPAAEPNVCKNARDKEDGNCLVDPILHTCLGERAVQLPPDGNCYDPGALARAWTVKRQNPLSRAPFGDADEAAVRAWGELPPLANRAGALPPLADDAGALTNELERALQRLEEEVDDADIAAVLQNAMDLIRRGAAADAHNSLTLVLALVENRRDLTDELLGLNIERRPQPSARQNEPLQIAADNRWWETVNTMLRVFRFGPPWANFPLVFAQACAAGSEETVVRLLELAGTAVEASYHFNSNLRAAAAGGHVGVVDVLLRLPSGHGVSPAYGYGAQALVEAVRGGHAAVVARLMADVRTPTHANHGAALVEAALAGRTDIARLLLRPPPDGAVQASAYEDNWRAALMAAIFGREDVLTELRVSAEGARVVRARAPFPLLPTIQRLLDKAQ